VGTVKLLLLERLERLERMEMVERRLDYVRLIAERCGTDWVALIAYLRRRGRKNDEGTRKSSSWLHSSSALAQLTQSHLSVLLSLHTSVLRSPSHRHQRSSWSYSHHDHPQC